jgi:hypothetical protein
MSGDWGLEDLSGFTEEVQTVVAEPPRLHARADHDELALETTRIARPGRMPDSQAAPETPPPKPVEALVPPPRRVPFSMAPTVIQMRPAPPPLPRAHPEGGPHSQPPVPRRDPTETGVIRAPREAFRPDRFKGVDLWGIAAALTSSALGGALLLTAAAWIVGGG